MWTVVYAVWMLAAVAVAGLRREAAFCCAAGAIALAARAVAGRAWRSPSGALAVANLLTFARLGLVVVLPWLLAWLPAPAFVALVVSLLVLDGVDGRVARARGESSALGASLDMETDALTVMVLTLLLWTRGTVGPWVLVAGLWRYVLAVATALVPAIGDAPPSRLYRTLFGVLMLALACAFAPWAPLARASAAFGTALVSFSFLHSIARSRVFRPGLNGGGRP